MGMSSAMGSPCCGATAPMVPLEERAWTRMCGCPTAHSAPSSEQCWEWLLTDACFSLEGSGSHGRLLFDAEFSMSTVDPPSPTFPLPDVPTGEGLGAHV